MAPSGRFEPSMDATGRRATPSPERRFDRLMQPINRIAGSRLVRTLGPLAILGIAAWLIRREVRAVSFGQVLGALGSTPLWALGLSGLFTLACYGCVGTLEWYAVNFIGRQLPRGRVALASAGATAMSNAMGFGLASGTAVRLRFYSFAGLAASDAAKITGLVSAAAFIGGLVAEGVGVLLALSAVDRELKWPIWAVAAAGVVLLVPAVVWFPVLRRLARAHDPRALSRRGRVIVLLASVGGWVFQAAALFVLGAGPPDSFPALLAAYCFAGLIGSTLGVPGDLGVLEAVVLGSGVLGAAHQGAAALILFRLVFHFSPLVIATAAMSGRQMVRLFKLKG
jgi:uncharacterized membrane protein YbhN (UPF0104 family)